MEFCPKCGSVIMGRNCARCDYQTDEDIKLESSQKMETKKEVAVVTEGDHEINPIIEMVCEKCKNPTCYFWTKQTRASDEAETRFYKCTKCRYTWRVYH